MATSTMAGPQTNSRGSVSRPAAPPQTAQKHLRHPGERQVEANRRDATDDEILGISTSGPLNPAGDLARSKNVQGEASEVNDATNPLTASSDAANSTERDEASARESDSHATNDASVPAELREVLATNPELERAWQDREEYRASFATPEEARAATAQLRDLDRLDALFFSRQPEDHAQLAAAIATMDPVAFTSLVQAMSALASSKGFGDRAQGIRNTTNLRQIETSVNSRPATDALAAQNPASPLPSFNSSSPSAAEAEFFHATNAAAVEGVLGAIEAQVEKLLPEGVSKNARNRAVGEIYRELDATLRSNRQLSQQLRTAFKSGGLDADHQRAIVSLITGRARQALPAVAKRVLNEWTSTIVAANQDRRARQRAAEQRVDIAGSSGAGNDGRRPMTPRDINYARMSDADILNL